jgi:Bacteriophage lambda head decoration protein D
VDLTIRKETLKPADQSWLASAHGTNTGRSITLDKSAFTAGTHYPDGFFRSGIPLGRITASGKYAPYNNAASDGTEVLAGFLFDAPKAPDGDIDPQGVLFWHGAVIESKIPTNWTLPRTAAETAGVADVAGRIVFF